MEENRRLRAILTYNSGHVNFGGCGSGKLLNLLCPATFHFNVLSVSLKVLTSIDSMVKYPAVP